MIRLAPSFNCTVAVHEIDFLRDRINHDLTSVSLQAKSLEMVKTHSIFIVTPPCNTHSRLVWQANGPPPIRNSSYPWGFPWLRTTLLAKAETSNILVRFTESMLLAINDEMDKRFCLGVTEHPEDLGRVNRLDAASCPASIWRLPSFHSLVAGGKWKTGAFHQGPFGSKTSKATRLIYSECAFDDLVTPGWPTFDSDGMYTGPLPTMSNDPGMTIVRQKGETGAFSSGPTASYPPALCERMARHMLSAATTSQREGANTRVASSMIVPSDIVQGFPPSPSLGLPTMASTSSSMPTSSGIGNAAVDSFPGESHSSFFADLSGDEDTQEDPSLQEATLPLFDDFSEDSCMVKKGWWGVGPPIRVKGKLGRYLRDGGGFCSPGRWRPENRVLPPKASLVSRILEETINALGDKACSDLISRLLLGRVTATPFASLASSARARLLEVLEGEGFRRRAEKTNPASVDFELVTMLAYWLEDPDPSAAELCINGVNIGFMEDLPATPTVWPAKTKWKLGEPDLEELSETNSNYISAVVHHKALVDSIEEQLELGFMSKTTYKVAKARYGDRLRIASMAVVQEGPEVFRTLHDATHKVMVNYSIKIPDRELYPSAEDVQGAVTADGLETATSETKYIALVSDVSKAHRRIPVREQDWGLQACSISPQPKDLRTEEWPILLNLVGTYGVASAAWYWGRFGALALRLVFYCTKVSYGFRFADDYKFLCRISGANSLRPLLHILLLFQILEIPMKWSKTKGGTEVSWIGFFFHYENLKHGLSDSRSKWLASWLNLRASNGVVVIRDLKGCIGRLGFASGVLSQVKPFLAPLYSWSAIFPDSAAHPIPLAIRLVMKWIAKLVLDAPLVDLRRRTQQRGELFRADAKAEGMTVVVGGWEVLPGSDRPSPNSRWYSVQLDPVSAPWAFSKGLPFRTIGALELFGSLLSLIFFAPTADRKFTLQVSGATDNLGNQGAKRKNLSTRYPLCLILMELSSQLVARGIELDLNWRRRDTNIEADALTNGEFGEFDPSLRIVIDLKSVKWIVMNWLADEALIFYKQMKELKEAAKSQRRDVSVQSSGPVPKKRAKFDKLRLSDPW